MNEEEYAKVWLYRGIPSGVTIWNGEANGKSCQAPNDERFYDLVELVTEDYCHAGYKWTKSDYTKPEVFYYGSWHEVPDSYFC